MPALNSLSRRLCERTQIASTMKRRGNKSNKVCHLACIYLRSLMLYGFMVSALRPAEKGVFSRPLEESCWAADTQAGSDDTILLDLCPRPFKGIVICATGVPDKRLYRFNHLFTTVKPTIFNKQWSSERRVHPCLQIV